LAHVVTVLRLTGHFSDSGLHRVDQFAESLGITRLRTHDKTVVLDASCH
jgi:hypothetical protein